MLVTGWGSIVGDPSAPSYPNDLRKVTVPLFDRVDCNDADSYGGFITARMLCAGAASRGACFADSGGPLARNNTLLGIVSWGGVPCASDPERPTVYARVSHNTPVGAIPGIRSWIVARTP